MELERPDAAPGESGVATVFIGVHYTNGAVRQYTAHRPLNFALAVKDGESVAALAPGMMSGRRMEPRIMVLFEGNPDAGGVEVHQEGEAP